MSQLNYSFDELMAEHDYATKIRHKDKTLHGGLLADGTYRPPRSLNRTPAIEAWWGRLKAEGRDVEVLDRDAINRANAYRDAGADMIFPEGLRSEDDFARFAQDSPGLLLANMTEFGKTPDIPADRFAELGYDLVIYPLSMMRLAMGHIARGLQSLREHGTVRHLLDDMQTRAELYDLLDYTPGEQWNFSRRP